MLRAGGCSLVPAVLVLGIAGVVVQWQDGQIQALNLENAKLLAEVEMGNVRRLDQ